MEVKDIVVVNGARTPFGTYCGSLKDHSATDLGVIAGQGALQRASIFFLSRNQKGRSSRYGALRVATSA